jgi:Domain of unknown function (DUF6285)
MADPHDAPSMRQLVQAVREFLETDVLPAVDGRVRFHSRVAINVLGMVERELELGHEQARAHFVRLVRLGYGDDAALAAAIRAGGFDDHYDLLKAALLEAVRAKLQVANPGYLEA